MNRDSKKVTMQDIAKRLNISQNTVSLALRNVPTVKRETREEILRVAQELGYNYANTPDLPQNMNICIFTDSHQLTSSYYYLELRQCLEEKLANYGYGLIVNNIFGIDLSRERLEVFCKFNRIAGIVVFEDIKLDRIMTIFASGLPVVNNGTYFFDRPMDCVLEDNMGGVFVTASQLRQRGYKSVGYIGNPQLFVAFRERYISFFGAVKEHDLETRPEWIVDDFAYRESKMDTLFLNRFLAMEKLPDAFMCANDVIALHAMKAARNMGLRIPEDIGFVGCDDIEPAKEAKPRLATINPNNDQQAEQIARLLVSRIKGDDCMPVRIVVPISFIDGGTIRPLD